MNPTDLLLLIIRPTLKHLGLWSLVAERLIIGIVYQESRGKYLKQFGTGPALGIYQIEPFTHDDLWATYLKVRRQDFAELVSVLMSSQPVHEQLITNLAYATAIARLLMYRIKEPLPSDPEDLHAIGAYWKKYYNTAAGKGTIEEFVAHFPLEVLKLKG